MLRVRRVELLRGVFACTWDFHEFSDMGIPFRKTQ